MSKITLDVRPEKEYKFTKQDDGSKVVDLYRNIVEKDVIENGQLVKKYEAEHIKILLPEFDTKTEDNFKTQAQRDYYFDTVLIKKQDLIINNLYKKLNELDDKSDRPMRAILANMGDDDDIAKLKEIETEAKAVRRQLHEEMDIKKKLLAKTEHKEQDK